MINHRTATTLLLSAVLLHSTKAWNYPRRSIDVVPSQGVRGLLKNATAVNATNTTADELSSPTSSPTESPAPSPSPSYTPTITPTVTPEPTGSPTASPTESPAPSPSPSYTPTLAPTDSPQPSFQPTTTRFPTEAPSSPPSPSPTTSPMPSSRPSYSPTKTPSSSPTVSAAPSLNPSASPSVSSMPSNVPTYIGTQSAFFTAHLELTKKLTSEEQLAFVTGTEDYIDQLSIDGGLSVPQVVLEFQALVTRGFNMTMTTDGTETSVTATSDYKVDGAPPSERTLEQQQVTTTSESSTLLELHFEVTAIYTGADTEFDLFAALNSLFQKPDELWIHMLGNYNDVFLPLRPIDASAIQGNANASEKAISAGGLSAILVIALVAVGLAIGAAVYSVRSYTLSEYGEALDSPRGSSTGTMMVNEFGMQQQYPMKDSYMDPNAFVEARTYPDNTILTEQQMAAAINQSATEENEEHQENTGRPSIMSDNIFGDLDCLNQRIGAECLGGGQLTNIPLQRSHGSVDPPTESEVGVSEANYEQYGFRIDPTTSRDHAHMMRQVLGARPGGANEHIGMHNQPNAQFAAPAGIYYNGQPNPSFYVDDQELMLTKSMGGTLGAAPIAMDSPSTSASGQSVASSFFNNILSGKKKKKPQQQQMKAKHQSQQPTMESTGYLGARPLRDDGPQQLDNLPASYESAVRRGGLYDVFAPAGPIGIVVDTTKEGPCVHSLKPTSPMLGLINAGDLIVGLDDEDTRGMTAATLTRLMARKSNQKERKITLLAIAGY
ncbi:hypothetical protein MPSEU_000983100 [Mayamaea pseudoterrestris]|nr:hypothetical protein MPSEU_000983100 [Mayamaea pseudoterrestris]